jgi:hypothetical protein
MNAPLEAILNFRELRAALMFANTPTYLYTRFHRDSSVRYLAQQYETCMLLDDLDETLRGPLKNIDELVKAYALCISLSFKPFIELSKLKDFASKEIEWFQVIKKLVFEDAPKAQHIVVNVKSPPLTVTVRQNSTNQRPLLSSNEPVGVFNRGGLHYD